MLRVPCSGSKAQGSWWRAWKGRTQNFKLSARDDGKLLIAFEEKLVIQSCLTLGDPMDCNPAGSSVCGILQARILEWVAILFSVASSQSRDQTRVSCIAGRFFPVWATREAFEEGSDIIWTAFWNKTWGSRWQMEVNAGKSIKAEAPKRLHWEEPSPCFELVCWWSYKGDLWE